MNRISQTKLDNFYLYYQHPQILYDFVQKIENLQFVQAVKFEFIGSVKNRPTLYLLLSHYSRGESCKVEDFVDFATTGNHCRLSNIYIKRNFFHQGKLGLNVELHNADIVLLKSPRDEMQISPLSAS